MPSLDNQADMLQTDKTLMYINEAKHFGDIPESSSSILLSC